ncbi:hypothetical protein KM043_016242 [Ampulex compressa]|nr:hypothetical protein KM043_016242 [Ampulex compressa]
MKRGSTSTNGRHPDKFASSTPLKCIDSAESGSPQRRAASLTEADVANPYKGMPTKITRALAMHIESSRGASPSGRRYETSGKIGGGYRRGAGNEGGEEPSGIQDIGGQDYRVGGRRGRSTRRNVPRLNYLPSEEGLTSAIALAESPRKSVHPLIIYPEDEEENSR